MHTTPPPYLTTSPFQYSFLKIIYGFAFLLPPASAARPGSRLRGSQLLAPPDSKLWAPNSHPCFNYFRGHRILRYVIPHGQLSYTGNSNDVFRLVGSHLCNTFSRHLCTLPSPLSCTHCTVHMLLAGAREARRHYFSLFPHHQSDGTQVCFSKLQPSFLSHFMHSCMAVVCRYSSTAVPACLMLRLTVK